ncbi:flavin reductase family protein [Shouchella patagoniensis]|uniref:flavin reductase family protein n=1 Tax=Shouchella patagoniensis TaxID=228576 RepID=UPI0009959C31|nr:flavin reductase family protein [Shouchella patagoniensis]
MDDRLFKTAMSKFSTGVTVITAEWENENHGMTANAFMSVSLDPKLIVISVANNARMKPILEKTKTFAVSVLAEDQADVSMHFARQKEKENVRLIEFAGVPTVEGAIATIACDLHDTSEQGDHTLFIGKVRDVAVTDRDPLVYYQGKYEQI